MLLSRKSHGFPGIRLLAVELPIRRKRLSEGSDALQHMLTALVACNVESPFARNVGFNLIVFHQFRPLVRP